MELVLQSDLCRGSKSKMIWFSFKNPQILILCHVSSVHNWLFYSVCIINSDLVGLLAFQERSSGYWPGPLNSPSSCSNMLQGSAQACFCPCQLLFRDGIGRKSSPSRQANCRQAVSWWNRSSLAVLGFNLQCLRRPRNNRKAALFLCL